MPRTNRLDWKNAVNHVIVRGIEKGSIFKDDRDRKRFISRLEKCIDQTGITVYAWALMPNHVHFLTRTGDIPLAKFMQKLLTGHANYFNHKYDRAGHLFQNRYRSILVQADRYLLKLIRYIHLNPLKAGIVTSLEELGRYPWTGHIGILFEGLYPWQASEEVLDLISGHRDEKITQYNKFIKEDESIPILSDSELIEGSYLLGSKGLLSLEEVREQKKSSYIQHRILGDIDFARHIYARIKDQQGSFLRKREHEHEIIDKLLEFIKEYWGVSHTTLTSKGRSRASSRAREFMSYALVNQLGMSLVDTGKILNLSAQGVLSAARRFRSTEELKSAIQRITET
ncbi:MAG: transposase [Candidatus Aegiribacteria sp.]|nr:transposase [Candidatus Aegiribacteria sp.]